MKAAAITFLPLLLAATLALAQEEPAAAEAPASSPLAPPVRFDPVEIQGMGKPQRASGKQVAAAWAAVDALRAQHGPRAEFLLRVQEREAPGEPGPTARLRLLPRDEEQEAIDLVAVGAGRFGVAGLAPAQLQEGELQLNRATGQARLLAQVRTPGQSPHQVRLGDLRLECAALWAMERDQVPWLIRTSFAAIGGACQSGRINILLPWPEALQRAELVEGDRRIELPLGPNGRSMRAPLHDKSWGDEALVITTALP